VSAGRSGGGVSGGSCGMRGEAGAGEGEGDSERVGERDGPSLLARDGPASRSSMLVCGGGSSADGRMVRAAGARAGAGEG
jgi:hypothetical protein